MIGLPGANVAPWSDGALRSVDAMSDVELDPVPIEHRRLRSAIEFAVAEAKRGQRTTPPEPFPDVFARFLPMTRIPAGALGQLRRAIEADEGFRRRVAGAAAGADATVDAVGREWLCAREGWRARAVALIEADREVASAEAAGAELRRVEKRRAAAEHAAERARDEVAALRRRLDDVLATLEEARRAATAAVERQDAMAVDLVDARTAARHADDRARAAARRLDDVTADLTTARGERDQAIAQRDALLAERAERAGLPVAAADLGALREVAERARRVADQLAAVVATPSAPTRTPLSLPGGVSRDSTRATELLLRSGGLVLIDGYNVSIATWPDEPLAEQRRRLLDLCDGLARRYGSDIAVIFDGADVVGAHHAGPRRLVRVRYSPAGVTADDVIRAEVAGVATSRPVVVVTDDGEVRRDTSAAGANLIGRAPFVELARRV